jgi:hypothetical protein
MRRTLIVCVALAAGSYGAYRWTREPVSHVDDGGAVLVKDRIWVDHIPRSDTDTMQLFVVLNQRPRQPAMGLFEAISAWEGAFQAFRYQLHGNQLRVEFPQRRDRETITVHAARCSENGMDFCLTVDGSSRGVKRYYSRKGWEVRELADVTRVAASLAR